MPRTTTITLPDRNTLGMDNDGRAELVRPFIQAFATLCDNDSLEQAIGDFIADLGHLWERLAPDERDSDVSDPFVSFEEFVETRAFYHYEAEVEEEQEQT